MASTSGGAWIPGPAKPRCPPRSAGRTRGRAGGRHREVVERRGGLGQGQLPVLDLPQALDQGILEADVGLPQGVRVVDRASREGVLHVLVRQRVGRRGVIPVVREDEARQADGPIYRGGLDRRPGRPGQANQLLVVDQVGVPAPSLGPQIARGAVGAGVGPPMGVGDQALPVMLIGEQVLAVVYGLLADFAPPVVEEGPPKPGTAARQEHVLAIAERRPVRSAGDAGEPAPLRPVVVVALLATGHRGTRSS